MGNPGRISAIALFPMLFVGGFVVIIAIVLCASVPAVVEWARLGSYVQTTGTLRASDIQALNGGYAGGTHRGGGVAPSFIPVVWYDYTVNGRAFTGNRIRMMPVQTHSLAEAQRVIAAFGGPPSPPSTPLTVWYDPSHPERSLLLRDQNGEVLNGPVAWLGLAGLMGFMFLYARWVHSKRKADGPPIRRLLPPH